MYFSCLSYIKWRKEYCSTHSISEEQLYNVVLSNIKRVASESQDESFTQSLIDKLNETKETELKYSEKE